MKMFVITQTNKNKDKIRDKPVKETKQKQTKSYHHYHDNGYHNNSR